MEKYGYMAVKEGIYYKGHKRIWKVDGTVLNFYCCYVSTIVYGVTYRQNSKNSLQWKQWILQYANYTSINVIKE